MRTVLLVLACWIFSSYARSRGRVQLTGEHWQDGFSEEQNSVEVSNIEPSHRELSEWKQAEPMDASAERVARPSQELKSLASFLYTCSRPAVGRRLPAPLFAASRSAASRVSMALDYKDPEVAKEFAACQSLDTEQVEDELAASGIPVPPTMNDMDMRMMLVEMRMRKSGKIGTQKPKPKKAPEGANNFEKALYEKPAFRELYERWQQERNTNAMNLATEHLMDPRQTKERYGGTELYARTLAVIEEALNKRVEQEVVSGKISFSGFPANMGEAGVKMTLEAFGPLSSFSWEADDDGMTASGRAEFGSAAEAKAAIDKYDGMDMGLGTTLELQGL